MSSPTRTVLSQDEQQGISPTRLSTKRGLGADKDNNASFLEEIKAKHDETYSSA